MRFTKGTPTRDHCFASEPAQRELGLRLYASVKDLPLVCPHGHVSPALLDDPEVRLGSPADLFIIPDHYVFRMLYSQGVAMEDLGVPTKDGTPVEQDHRQIWQRFADHFYLFRGTPTGLWLRDELSTVFGVDQTLNSGNAQQIYDQLETKLATPEFAPRALLKRFNIEVLCTTDSATDRLEHHQTLQREGLTVVRPTFRPDGVVNLETPAWQTNIETLSKVSAIEVNGYAAFIRALEERRAFFKQMGATATDHAAVHPHTERLSDQEAEGIFGRALQGTVRGEDAARFTAHMLMEMARMSVEDGLVMQLHAGSIRNHNQAIFDRFGTDMGADIPTRTDWTHGLRALLNAYGNDSRLRLILFTLDEGTYGRELAPLAGHYPAVLLGPPWWFFDSVNGMRRFLDLVVETAGLYNTAGFNDDTRAFVSIPSRHDVWRRVSCDWLAGLAVQGLIEADDAQEMAHDMAYRLSRRAYRITA
ncbi:MAG: glucuronate isomerase [Herpetosiphon sp.]